MRAILKPGPHPGLEMTDVEEPDIGPEDILIRVSTTSICGTDLHIDSWDSWAADTIPTPLIVGHEFTGSVAQIGSGVHGFEVGDRVSGEGHITCGHCRNCRGGMRNFCHNHVGVGVTRAGAFADLISLPAANVFSVPDHINDDIAAILDPLGNATHTALAFQLVGEDVLITGAGPIGAMAAAIARHIGARYVVITDVNDYRLDLAAKLGATRTVNVATTDLASVMTDLGMLEGFDIGMEMSGNEQAVGQLLEVMNNGGRVGMLGIPAAPMNLDLTAIIFKGLTVKGIYGRRIFETWYQMAAMLQSGLSVDDVITHRFPAEEFRSAFEVVRSGRSGKVLLDWT